MEKPPTPLPESLSSVDTVTGFTGEQYALPEAAEQLTHVAKLPRTGERVTVNATDPLNLVGVIVPGANVPTVRTRHVVYVDGVPEEAAAAVEPVREEHRVRTG